MDNLKEKLLEERKVLLVGLFFGFVLGFSASLVLQEGNGRVNALAKDEIGRKTEDFIGNTITQGTKRNLTVKYVKVEEAVVPGLYNVTIRIKEANITSSVLVSKDGKWFFGAQKVRIP